MTTNIPSRHDIDIFYKLYISGDVSKLTGQNDHPLATSDNSSWKKIIILQNISCQIQADIIRGGLIKKYNDDDIEQKVKKIIIFFLYNNSEFEYIQSYTDIAAHLCHLINTGIITPRGEYSLDQKIYNCFELIICKLKNVFASDCSPNYHILVERLRNIQIRCLNRYRIDVNKCCEIDIENFGVKWLRTLFLRLRPIIYKQFWEDKVKDICEGNPINFENECLIEVENRLSITLGEFTNKHCGKFNQYNLIKMLLNDK